MMLPFKRIVVVGGGAAGWMTAAALVTALKGRTVELVESEEIGIVGVGEATFPSIRNFHHLLDIDETEFLRATNGSCKLGIEFRDWRAGGESYFHTVGDFGELSGPNSVWGQYRRLDEAGLGTLGEQCLSSVMDSQGRFIVPREEHRYDYAYHFDAALYAGFLRKPAERRGAPTAASTGSPWPTGAWWTATCLSIAPASPRCCWGARWASRWSTSATGCRWTGPGLARANASGTTWRPTRAPPRSRRAGRGGFRCKAGSATATSSPAATLTRTARASNCCSS
jgi:hypothetical protein